MRPTLSVRHFLAATFMLTALSACQDPSGLSPAPGRFVLNRLEGQPLPVLVGLTPTDSVFLESEELDLGPDGRGTRFQILRFVANATGLATRQSFSLAIEYRRTAAGRLELTYVCGPNANGLAGPHASGWVTRTGLTLTSGAQEAVYLRVSPQMPYGR